MKSFLLCLLFMMLTFISKLSAQVNLVLNPSFEIYPICPWSINQIQLAKYWSPIDSTGLYEGINVGGSTSMPVGVPEYINNCAEDSSSTAINCGEPWSDGFYHYPRTGTGMVQNMMYFDESFESAYRRDYTQGRLSNGLTEGASYCVTFYVANEQISSYAINHIGAYFDNGHIDSDMTMGCCFDSAFYYYDTNSAQPLPGIIPQILDTEIIIDTLGWATWDSAIYEHRWTKIQGSFIANGGERFITIGNFFDAEHTDTVSVKSPSPTWGRTYWSWYLIDDVSVVRSDAVADAGPDITTSPGYPVWIGNDTSAVGGGDGMPCWWYQLSGGAAIDSGGRIQVHPDTTTTYVMMMDLCGNITYDTVTVWVWPLTSPNPSKGGGLDREVLLLPNPLSSLTPNVTISGNVTGCSYQVMNSIGQVLLQGVLQGNKNDIDVSGLLPGVYMINLSPSPESRTYGTGQALSEGEGGIIRKKLVKL